jgi:hypothetical protein
MSISSTIRAKLTPEQLVIAEKWEAERNERDKLYDIMIEAQKNGKQDIFEATCQKIIDITPEFCEHNHYILDDCSDCDALEKILYPEGFDDNGDRIELI